MIVRMFTIVDLLLVLHVNLLSNYKSSLENREVNNQYHYKFTYQRIATDINFTYTFLLIYVIQIILNLFAGYRVCRGSELTSISCIFELNTMNVD